MNQNKKIWFFTEGYSEAECIKCLFHKHFPSITICETESDFLQENAKSVCYIHNSQDGFKIPYAINDMNHWVERASTDKVIIFCDIEKEFLCSIERKNHLLDKLDADAKHKQKFKPVNKDKLFFVFSKPTIEHIYCTENEITLKVLKKLYNQVFDKISLKVFNTQVLSDETIKPLDRLKRLFLSYGLTYKKRSFAEDFFPRLDYSKSNNRTIERLYIAINGMVNNK